MKPVTKVKVTIQTQQQQFLIESPNMVAVAIEILIIEMIAIDMVAVNS